MLAKLLRLSCMTLPLVLTGCSQAPEQNSSNGQTAQSKTPSTAQQSAQIKGPFVQPTTVPNSASERQQLMQQLTQQNDANAKRLSLFVRYTDLTSAEVTQQPLETLIEDIDKQLKANPEDHEVRALLGSATSLKAIFYLDDVGQTNLLAKKGGRQLDRAVKKAPNHLGVRLYRGITYAEMPAFLGKARFAQQDFELMKQALKGDIDPDYIAMINYYYSMSLIKNNQKPQAQQILKQIIGDNNSTWTSKAKTLLKEAS